MFVTSSQRPPDPETVFARLHDGVRGRRHAGGVLVEHPDSGAALVVDPMAWSVARAFDGTMSCAEVATRFLEEAQAGAGGLMVLSLAATLQEHGLSELSDHRAVPAPAHELDPSLPAALEDTLASLRGQWIFDANHHLPTLLLLRLARWERADLAGGMRKLYAGLQSLAERGCSYVTPSLLVTTTQGRLALEEHLLSSELPTLPTVLHSRRQEGPESLRQRIDAMLAAHPTHGGVVVHKNLLVHRGEAVRLVPLPELDDALAQARHLDVFQPLLPGPAADGHQRDYRCVLVDGRVVNLWERRAARPLLSEDPADAVAPTSTEAQPELGATDLERVATNFHRGGTLRQLEPGSEPDVEALALRVAAAFDDAERAFRARWGVAAPYPGSVYLSVDLLRGPDGAPVYCELHGNPHYPEQVRTAPVANALADLAKRWCTSEAGRGVLVLGDDTPGPAVARECERRGLAVRHLV